MVGDNKNVKMMMGDYMVAVRKMAWPMILSMLITMSYNLIDGIWVSVLGAAPLAAVGFVTPLFMVVNGLANGLGAGASSFI
ncbi:MAG: MATE family efflux transporter, partial [Methanobrevibacter sp.]